MLSIYTADTILDMLKTILQSYLRSQCFLFEVTSGLRIISVLLSSSCSPNPSNSVLEYLTCTLTIFYVMVWLVATAAHKSINRMFHLFQKQILHCGARFHSSPYHSLLDKHAFSVGIMALGIFSRKLMRRLTGTAAT